ncbi:MAG: hypothetical protein VX899_01700 [Myxococcota bacterium]|nr:hypothetical protein [Myxococcota bacterium]
MLLWLLACGGMGDPATTLRDVQVLTIASDPGVLGPGSVGTLDTFVADPVGEGIELLQWPCTPTSDGECAEHAAILDGTSEDWLGLTRSDQTTLSVDIATPAALQPLLGPDPLPLWSVWTLACAPGLCPLMEAQGDTLVEGLADPTELLVDLPIDGVSLTRGWVYGAAESSPAPGVSCSAPETAAPEGEVLVSCTLDALLDDDSALYGYATAGGWEAPFVETGLSGPVEYAWYAPEDPGTVTLYVVVVDARGGQGIWSGSLRVE